MYLDKKIMFWVFLAVRKLTAMHKKEHKDTQCQSMRSSLIKHTVKTFNSCTSQPDICQCLVVKHPWWTNITNQSYFQLQGHTCIHIQETGLQSGVRLCIMPGLSRHLVQELNVGTVGPLIKRSNEIYTFQGNALTYFFSHRAGGILVIFCV